MLYWQSPDGRSLPKEEDYLNVMMHGQQSDICKMLIRDIRNSENEFTLDKNGFQLVRLAPPKKFTKDEEELKSLYYSEVEQLIKKL